MAREGSPAPGVATSGLFANFGEGVSLNAQGESSFRANLMSGGGVTSATNAGIWTRSRFTGNVLALAARKGFAAPGTGTATFGAFDYPFLNDDGREAFTATLSQSSATGVTSSYDRGFWVRNSTGVLELAIREGRTFNITPADTRIVSAITLPATGSAGRTPLSQDGRILVLIGFTDGTAALYHYRLP
jgi:hypothetical protein